MTPIFIGKSTTGTAYIPDPAPVTLDAVAGFIQSWADAWEAHDSEGVLAHYAADFDATAAGGRAAWEASVRQQLAGSEHIRVAISGLDVSFSESGTARAVFFRSWRSESRDESNRVALDLEPTTDGWKIRREQVLD